jgi:hypothetical protein
MSDEELIQRLGSQHTAAIARLNASNVIDDLKPCPSCREPLDHPSGDGCANMTAHKERAMSDDKELIARLRSKRQKGNRFDSLEYEAADRIEALTKERDVLISQHAVMMMERDAAQFEIEQLEAARADAKEAEAYAEELEKERDEWKSLAEAAIKDDASKNIYYAELKAKLATCEKYRDAYAECDRIGTQAVRDLEAKLAKAVEALKEALYFLKPTESDMEKKAGIYRIVTTLAEIESSTPYGLEGENE